MQKFLRPHLFKPSIQNYLFFSEIFPNLGEVSPGRHIYTEQLQQNDVYPVQVFSYRFHTNKTKNTLMFKKVIFY